MTPRDIFVIRMRKSRGEWGVSKKKAKGTLVLYFDEDIYVCSRRYSERHYFKKVIIDWSKKYKKTWDRHTIGVIPDEKLKPLPIEQLTT
jgi:hypothetical protein